ncbi:zinc finger BED domain-containing protein RICESLEEPER 1-like [Coffea eugenioides]|uniref:zinc finger BED domain-containing protein RICESLEEPER 1-like n=1 Tax=Coffea eugenioides TaxID=49369 RepID=UPI000F60B4FE|nr:zinc finger BED domain-containing protein RICESLEEPER 1-like [Coffea eugenioides]
MQSDTGPSTGGSRLAVVPQGLGGCSPPEISSIPQLSNVGSSSPILVDSPVFVSNNTTPNLEIHVTDQGTEKTPVENEGTQVNAMEKNVTEGEQDKGDDEFHIPKRSKTSQVWDDFEEIEENGTFYATCVHCRKKLSRGKSKQTSSMLRHRISCSARKVHLRMVAQQTKLNFQPADEIFSTLPALHTGKFDMEAMREAAAHWVLMHEHPFTILEEEGFNIMMRRGMPECQKISRGIAKNDCVTVYEVEKNKLKHVQQLQKRILNFVHIPPPRRGVEIAAAIFKCVKEWEIDHKIHTISVDNASNNDVAIRLLKDDFSRSKKLLCGGKLFHVRCCPHILNLVVQDGLSKIVDITNNIRESVEFVNRSEGRALLFAEIAQ